jgi:hypothetical protein
LTSFTVHVRAGRPVVLVPERFSLGALLFGPAWLLFVGAWIPAVLLACAWVAVAVLTQAAYLTPVALGLAWFTGLAGRDLRRWSMARSGWRDDHVVVGANEEEALARLYRFHPLLGQGELPGRGARA